MGRTPAKIEHGVRCCASANIDKCTGCPYAGLHVGIGCKTILFRDVQDYLKEIKISAARIEDMTKQLESAQPKWISVIDNPPNEGDVVFAHDPDEGWIALVKVIRVNLASIDVKAIWPEHSPPFIAKVWTPLRLPEPPKEET